MTPRPDPRPATGDDLRAGWDLCQDCARSGGESWGSAVEDHLCLSHLDLTRQTQYFAQSREIDVRGCNLDKDSLIVTLLGGDTKVARRIMADGAVFFDHLFVTADLPQDVSFEGATFHGDLLVYFVEFSGAVSFESAAIHGEATFTGSTFKSGCDFVNAVFEGPTHFDRTLFSQDADFSGARFMEMTMFDRSRFLGEVDYSNADFLDEATFSGATFDHEARFDGTRFSRSAGFDGATFLSSVWFTRSLDDRDSRFSLLPDFRGAAFARGAVIESREALSGWFGGSKERASYVAGAFASQVRPLRQAVEAGRDDIGANVLFEIEMHLRTRAVRGWRRLPEKTVLRLYEVICGFGTRPLRALSSWLCVVVGAALLLTLGGYEAGRMVPVPPTPTTPSTGGAPVTNPATRSVGAFREPLVRQPALDALRSSIPGWTVQEESMTTLGRWVVTAARIFGAISLALFLLAVRAQVKR